MDDWEEVKLLGLDFIYRSANSDMSNTTDIAFIDSITMAVGFANGNVDIVNIDERKLVSTHKFEHPVIGMAYQDALLVVQTKSDTVSCWMVNEWKCIWKNECKSATTFAKPLILNSFAYYVSSGRSHLNCVSLTTGELLHVFKPDETVKGMVVALIATNNTVLVLFESNHLVEISNGDVIKKILIGPLQGTNIPTAISEYKSGTWLVGYSDGKVMVGSLKKKWELFWSNKGGIGIGAILGSRDLAGSWTGDLDIMNEERSVKSPHLGCAIRQIASSPEYIAIASSDGRVSTYLNNSE